MVADKTGSLAGIKRHDYLPFGEELFAGTSGRTQAQGYAADSVRQKFTAYERDDETGLDYAQARYHASKLGRFTSIDPLSSSAKLTDPQTLNRYSYVSNNPVVFSDPTGLERGYAGTAPMGSDGAANAALWAAGQADIAEAAGGYEDRVAQTYAALKEASQIMQMLHDNVISNQTAIEMAANNHMLSVVTEQTQEEFEASPEYPKLLQAYADELQKNVPGVNINWGRNHKIITSIDFPNDYDATVKQLTKAGYLSGIENAAFNPVNHPGGKEFRDAGSRTCELSFHFKILYPHDKYEYLYIPFVTPFPVPISRTPDRSPAHATDVHIDLASPLYGGMRGLMKHSQDFVDYNWKELQKKFGYR
jgi:RHS repeat-associated protein